MRKPLLIAHRGDTVYFSGNTLEAFESAFDKGADGVELDVQLFNGELIVVHDYLFDRNNVYPSLWSVLNKFGKKGRIEIEVKSFSTDIIEPLKKVLVQFPSIDFELTTCELPMVSLLADAFPIADIGAIFDQGQFREWMNEEFIAREIIELMTLMHANVAHISSLSIERLTKSLIDVLHANGLKVHYHLSKVASSEQISLYKQLQIVGVDQCTFDDSNLLVHIGT